VSTANHSFDIPKLLYCPEMPGCDYSLTQFDVAKEGNHQLPCYKDLKLAQGHDVM